MAKPVVVGRAASVAPTVATGMAPKSVVVSTSASAAHMSSAPPPRTRSGAAVGSTASSSSSSSSAAGGAGVSPALSTKGVGARGRVDVSTSEDVEAALKDLFAKNSPEFYLGDCLDIISQHAEWEAMFTLVLLDPPFGVLSETHDTQIPAQVILELCNFLLKPQGEFITYFIMPMPYLTFNMDVGSAVIFCTDAMIKEFEREIVNLNDLVPEQILSVR